MVSQNGIIGDDKFGTDLPTTQTPDHAFDEVLKTAKFSKSAEFKELKTYLQARMDFYRVYLPNGEPVLKEKDMAKLGANWQVANTIIGEFQAVIDVYENAQQAVKDELARRKGA